MRQLVISKQITNRQDESVNRYLKEISKYDLISVEEEVELTVRIRKGDLNALEQLVNANLRFVVSVAKQYQNKGLSFSDLINEGNLGLVKAAYKFDETRGFKFISYAVWWIRQTIIQALAEQVRIVRLPLNKISSINKLSKTLSKLEQQFQREPTNEELANEINISVEEAINTKSINNNQISLDAPLLNTEDNQNLYDVLKSSEVPPPDNNLLVESIMFEINRSIIKLSEREAIIINMTFGLNGSPVSTLNEISTKMNISTERVRQLKKEGILKLKKYLRYKNF